MFINNTLQMIDFWFDLSKKYNIILLYWPLWVWKTTIIKWFWKWLWIDQNLIKSPTYSYQNIYYNKLLHIDMYRIDKFSDLIEKWIYNSIFEFDYVAIEWPKFEENIQFNKFQNILKLNIKIIWNKREVIF